MHWLKIAAIALFISTAGIAASIALASMIVIAAHSEEVVRASKADKCTPLVQVVQGLKGNGFKPVTYFDKDAQAYLKEAHKMAPRGIKPLVKLESRLVVVVEIGAQVGVGMFNDERCMISTFSMPRGVHFLILKKAKGVSI